MEIQFFKFSLHLVWLLIRVQWSLKNGLVLAAGPKSLLTISIYKVLTLEIFTHSSSFWRNFDQHHKLTVAARDLSFWILALQISIIGCVRENWAQTLTSGFLFWGGKGGIHLKQPLEKLAVGNRFNGQSMKFNQLSIGQYTQLKFLSFWVPVI